MLKDKNIINTLIFCIGILIYSCINNFYNFDIHYAKWNNYIIEKEQVLLLIRCFVGISVILISLIIFPIINQLINYKFKKHFPNEKIYLTFYLKFDIIFWSVISIILQEWIIGKIFIPYFFFSNNLQNVFSIVSIALLSIIFFISCIEFQYNKFILTDKGVYLFSFFDSFHIFIRDIEKIVENNYGIELIYKIKNHRNLKKIRIDRKQSCILIKKIKELKNE